MRFQESDAKALLGALDHQDDEYIVRHGEQTIYGTGTAQKVYLRVQEYLSTTKPRDLNARAMAAHVATPHIVKENYPAISNYWLSVKNQYIANPALDTKPGEPPIDKGKKRFWGEFHDIYEREQRDPRTPPPLAKIKGPEIRAPGAAAFVPREAETMIDDIVVRRSCKFLLYNAIQRGQDIAYVLDDLDLDIVARRLKVEEDTTRQGAGTTERKVPVCTTELREIFRRWDFFADHLTFYLDWKVCDPPWFTHGREHWAAYADRLAAKLAGQFPADAAAAGNVHGFVVSASYMAAINAYHAMLPSRRLPGAFVHTVAAH